MREITIERVQQWKCISCKASFIFRRSSGKRTQYTETFIKETVSDFVMGGSYRRIQERREVSIGTLSSWIHEYGGRCMSPVEIAEYLHLPEQNKWSGILLLDGKYLNRHMVLLLAVDYRTQDVVSWRVAENESQDNYKQLITDVQNCGYIIKALISDGGTGIRALTQKKKPSFIRIGSRPYPRPGVSPAKEQTVFLSGVPHQWCIVHAQRELLKYVRTKAKKEEREKLTLLVNQILFSSTLIRAEKVRKKLNTYGYINYSEAAKRLTNIISSYWKLLIAHYTVRVGRFKIPPTTNVIENIISNLNTRLKTMKKIKTKKSAEAICRLIVLKYRMKPLVDSQDRQKRHKSPLELSIKKKGKLNWYLFIKKSCR